MEDPIRLRGEEFVPNNCENDLYVYGPKMDIATFLHFASNGDRPISADKFIPYPEPFRTMDRQAREKADEESQQFSRCPGFNSGGYEWCVKNWGTKWDFYNFGELKTSNRGIKVTFETAWSPPFPVIVAMSALFPMLDFKMKSFEHGAAFKCDFRVKAGKVFKEETGRYTGPRGG